MAFCKACIRKLVELLASVAECKGKPEQVTGIIQYEETKQRNNIILHACSNLQVFS